MHPVLIFIGLWVVFWGSLFWISERRHRKIHGPRVPTDRVTVNFVTMEGRRYHFLHLTNYHRKAVWINAVRMVLVNADGDEERVNFAHFPMKAPASSCITLDSTKSDAGIMRIMWILAAMDVEQRNHAGQQIVSLYGEAEIGTEVIKSQTLHVAQFPPSVPSP
jgi:hypothetical protein